MKTVSLLKVVVVIISCAISIPLANAMHRMNDRVVQTAGSAKQTSSQDDSVLSPSKKHDRRSSVQVTKAEKGESDLNEAAIRSRIPFLRRRIQIMSRVELILGKPKPYKSVGFEESLSDEALYKAVSQRKENHRNTVSSLKEILDHHESEISKVAVKLYVEYFEKRIKSWQEHPDKRFYLVDSSKQIDIPAQFKKIEKMLDMAKAPQMLESIVQLSKKMSEQSDSYDKAVHESGKIPTPDPYSLKPTEFEEAFQRKVSAKPSLPSEYDSKSNEPVRKGSKLDDRLVMLVDTNKAIRADASAKSAGWEQRDKDHSKRVQQMAQMLAQEEETRKKRAEELQAAQKQAEKQLAEIQAKIQETEESFKQAMAEREQQTNEKIEKFKADQESRRKQKDSLKAERDEYWKQRDAARKECSEWQAKVQTLKQTHSEAEQNNAAARSKMASEMASLVAQKQAASNEFGQISAQLANEKQRISQLSSQRQKEEQALVSRKAQLEAQINELSNKEALLKSSLATSESSFQRTLAAITQQTQAAQSRLETLRKQYTEEESQFNSQRLQMQAEKEKHQNEFAQVTKRIKDGETQLRAEQEIVMQQLNAQLDGVKNQIQQAEQTLQALVGKASKEEDRFTQAQSKRKALKEENQKFASELATAQSQAAAKERGALAELSNQQHTIQQQIKALTDELATKTAELEKAQAQQIKIDADQSQELLKLQQRIGVLQTFIDQLPAQLTELLSKPDLTAEQVLGFKEQIDQALLKNHTPIQEQGKSAIEPASPLLKDGNVSAPEPGSSNTSSLAWLVGGTAAVSAIVGVYKLVQQKLLSSYQRDEAIVKVLNELLEKNEIDSNAYEAYINQIAHTYKNDRVKYERLMRSVPNLVLDGAV